MNYGKVKSWIKDNYHSIKIIDRLDEPSDELELGLDTGDVLKADFNVTPKGYACIVVDRDGKNILGNYNTIIIVNNSTCDRRDTLSLLHELGHYTECQKGDVLYNEVMAWKGCVKHLETLGIDLEYVSFVRECLSTYEDAYSTRVNKYYHTLLKNNGFMTEQEFYKLYTYKNNPSKFYGLENWRKPWKIK